MESKNSISEPVRTNSQKQREMQAARDAQNKAQPSRAETVAKITQLAARQNLARYIVKTYWKTNTQSPAFKQLLSDVKGGKLTSKNKKGEEVKLNGPTKQRVMAIADPSTIQQLQQKDLEDLFMKKDVSFGYIIPYNETGMIDDEQYKQLSLAVDMASPIKQQELIEEAERKRKQAEIQAQFEKIAESKRAKEKAERGQKGEQFMRDQILDDIQDRLEDGGITDNKQMQILEIMRQYLGMKPSKADVLQMVETEERKQEDAQSSSSSRIDAEEDASSSSSDRGLLDRYKYELSQLNIDDLQDLLSNVPTVDMKQFNLLSQDEKRGAMHVVEKGSPDQQMELVKDLEKLGSMNTEERSKFSNKLKRFNNLAKLGDSANKLYAQALLDKRRQVLQGQLVLKTKQKKQKKQ